MGGRQDPEYARWCENWRGMYGGASSLQQVIEISGQITTIQDRDFRVFKTGVPVKRKPVTTLEEMAKW